MQFAATIGAEAYDVTRIGWDLGFIEHNMKHPLHLAGENFRFHE